MSWLEFALNPFPDLFAMPPGGVSAKVKDALLKKRLTDAQIGVAYNYLTRKRSRHHGRHAGIRNLWRANQYRRARRDRRAPRDSILDIACNTGWLDPQEEAKNLAWVRTFYQDLFAETGGVPVPGDAYDGSFINHPRHRSRGLKPEYIRRAVAYLVLQENYPRLQADQGAVGPAQCVPAWVVGSGGVNLPAPTRIFPRTS